MFNLSLTACSFFIKKTNSRNTEKIFALNSKIKGCQDDKIFCFNDVIDLFSAFFNSYAEIITDTGRQQTFSCECNPSFFDETSGFRLIYAKVFSGIYGSSSDIIDANSKQVKFTKSATDIDTRPFYVFVIVPKDSENVTVQKGMLIFQNVGQYGIKTITTEYMQMYFSSNWGITLKCRTIAPNLFIKKVIRQDNIKKLVMVKNLRSSDRSDNVGLGYGKEVREIADLNFSEALWKCFPRLFQSERQSNYLWHLYLKIVYKVLHRCRLASCRDHGHIRTFGCAATWYLLEVFCLFWCNNYYIRSSSAH